ncbi:MAG: tripartite tricarboxylate transporter permease [Pseudomonadota bacterium]
MLGALAELFGSPTLLGLLLLAVPIGLFFGVVPGLGGKIAIIAMLPLVFAMDQMAGCVFLISLHAVVHTGGAVPSILFGVPGTGPSTAIVADGHALARKGQAVRALTASSVASALGGVFGALVLALLVPFSREIVTYLSYPEIFFLTLFGILMAAGLSGDSVLRGLATGVLGLLIATMGISHNTGDHRFTFGAMFLWDGIDLITAILAIYAVPEMITLGARGRGSATGDLRMGRPGLGQVAQGVRDVIVFRWLTFRTSVLGAVTGFIPGLGGDVAAWVCYGHAAQTSPKPEEFGRGAIDGVIGPEAANNSKEGGSLAPTLFLGLPGSSGMAILLVALVPLGIDPGPGFLATQPEILWIMVWALVISNCLAAAIVVAFAPAFDRVSRLDPHVIVPFVFLLALFSIYLSANDWRFFGIAAGLSVLGLLFKRLDWPRAPFVVALILGPAAEDALVKSLAIWGPDFFLRPVSLPLMVILAFIGFRVSARLRRVAAASEASE